MPGSQHYLQNHLHVICTFSSQQILCIMSYTSAGIHFYELIVGSQIFAVSHVNCGSVILQLKINSAPVIIHFPAKGKPKKADTMDIHR